MLLSENKYEIEICKKKQNFAKFNETNDEGITRDVIGCYFKGVNLYLIKYKQKKKYDK